MKSNRWLLASPFLLVGGLAVAGVQGAGPMGPMLAEDDKGLGELEGAKLSPADTLTKSKQMTAKMGQVEQRVSSLQKRAETKKDLVMVNCVSDKLVQIRGYVAVGNTSAAGIEQAIQRNDGDTRAHQYDRQTIVYQKVLVLGTEAEGCVGQDVSYVGATVVEVEIDPSIPQEDPTIPPTPVPTADRPPEGDCPAV